MNDDHRSSTTSASRFAADIGFATLTYNLAIKGAWSSSPNPITTSYPYVTTRTRDRYSYYFTANQTNWFNIPSLLVETSTPPFIVGGWKYHGNRSVFLPDGELLFRTNLGGEQGGYRGIDVYVQQNADYISIVFGRNVLSGDAMRSVWATSAGSFPTIQTNFWAVYIDPKPTVEETVAAMKVYVNGAQKSLAYAGGTNSTATLSIAYVNTPSNPSGFLGVAFGAAGDTYGGREAFQHDEYFLHWSEINDSHMAKMYYYGSTFFTATATTTLSDTYWGNVAVLYRFDGTDRSNDYEELTSNSYSLSIVGTVACDDEIRKFGHAAVYFPGNGGRLALRQTSASFSLGISDFTIETWVRPEVSISGGSTLISKRDNNAVVGSFFLDIDSNKHIRFKSSFSGSAWDVSMSSSILVASATYQHVAVTRSNHVFRVFLDGINISELTATGTIMTNSAKVYIGGDSNINYYKGYMDSLRMTTDVARYTSDFTPPTDMFPAQ